MKALDGKKRNLFALDAIWTNEFGMSFGANVFEVKFDVVYQLHVHDVFQQSQQNVFSTGLHFRFWKLPNVFDNVFDVFGI